MLVWSRCTACYKAIVYETIIRLALFSSYSPSLNDPESNETLRKQQKKFQNLDLRLLNVGVELL